MQKIIKDAGTTDCPYGKGWIGLPIKINATEIKAFKNEKQHFKSLKENINNSLNLGQGEFLK